MKLLKKTNILIVYAVIVVLMAVGTFLDFNLSQLVCNSDSLFGRFFLLFGQFPVMLCGFTASALLMRSLPEKGNERILFIALAAGGILGGMIGAKEIIENCSGIRMILYILIELVIAGLLFLYVYQNCAHTDKRLLRRTAMFILFTVLITTAVVVFVKIPWGRPRYRSVIAVKGLEYQPWYVIGKTARDAFEGILDHDEFKSFPSGHTASASYLLCLITLKNVIPSLKNQEKALTIAAFAWILLTAAARIIAGAHFLTDVTIGFTVAFTILILTARALRIKAK